MFNAVTVLQCNQTKKFFSDESIKIQFWTIQPSEREKTCASTVTMSRIKISQTKRILGFICWNNVQGVNLTCQQLTFSRIAVFGQIQTFHQACKLPNRFQIKNTYMMLDNFNRFLLFICIKDLCWHDVRDRDLAQQHLSENWPQS